MSNQTVNEQGFSYIDVIIAIVIMMVGILAMVSALTANLIRTYENERRIVAKEYALSAMESVISAKEMGEPGTLEAWDQVRNVLTPPPDAPEENGIFLTDWNPVRQNLGADGVAGTADDACPEGGGCEAGNPTVQGFQRSIVITDVPDDERPTPPNPITRRRVDVTVRFNSGQAVRQETVSTIVANY